MDLMNRVCRSYLVKFIIFFIEDILIYSKSKEEHEVHLKLILELLKKEKLFRKFPKCEFWLREIAKPLTLLTQKDKKYEWGDEQENAFQTLKDMLACALRNFDLEETVFPQQEKMELETTQTSTTAKLPMLKQGDYKMWRLRIEQYFQVQDYALWDVIESRNSFVPVTQTTTAKGGAITITISSPVTAEENIKKKNDVKARSMLLMALPNEHLMSFNKYKDAKSLFATIETRFGSNEATKKTQKTLLKQMYEEFSAISTESLDSIFNRLQKIVSQLAVLGEFISLENLNLIFLRSLPSEWNTHVVVWRSKSDLDTISIDDLYNNFKIIKQDVKGTASSNSSSQNMAFVSSPSTNSTNKVHSTYGVSTASTQSSTASTQVSTASSQTSTANLIDVVVYAFLANQSNGSQLVHEDLEQIHEDDLEEIHLKWQNMYQDSSRRTVHVEETPPKVMVAIDGVGFDWSYMDEDKAPTNMALMAFLDSEGLASVEEELVFYKNNEITLCENIVVLTKDMSIKNSKVNVLKRSQITNKSKNGLGFQRYNVVPPPATLVYNTMRYPPPKTDLSYSGLEEFKQPRFERYGPKSSEIKSKNASEDIPNKLKEYPGASLVKDRVSDNKDCLVGSPVVVEKKTFVPNIAKVKFVKPKPQEKLVRKPVKYAKMYRERVVSRNNYTRVNYDNSTRKTHPNAHRNMAPRAVLMKTSLRPFNTAGPVNTAHPKTTVYYARPISCFSKSAQSTVKRPYQRRTTLTNKSFSQTVNTARPRPVNTARPRPVNTSKPRAINTARPNSVVVNAVRVNQINAVKASAFIHKKKINAMLTVDAEGDEQMVAELLVKELLKLNSVLFVDTGCFVLSLDFKLTDESQVLLKVPRRNDMYSVDIKNIVLRESLTCLVANATLDESMLWHRRLGHINFKNINKLVKDNLVRGLPSKRFKNDQTCVACLKGKQHNASYQLEKFDGKSDDGFFVGYSLNSKAFRNARNDKPQPSSDAENKDDEGVSEETEIDNQEKSENSTQDVNTVGPSINTASTNVNTEYGVLTRRMTKTTNDQGFISDVYEGKTHEDLYTCLFACFLSQEEPKNVIQALKDLIWIEAIQEDLLQFKLQFVWTLVDLPYGKRAIVEVYVCQPSRFKDPDHPDKVYKVVKALYGLHQALRAWSRLTSWQCKKQTIVASSTTEAEYVVAASCCGQVLWIQNQMLDYGYNFMNTKIFIDNESPICKPTEFEGFEQIIDFLNANPIKYALTVNPTIHTSYIKQFWATAKVKIVNGEEQIQALVDKKKVIITETSVRSDLYLKDAEVALCFSKYIFDHMVKNLEYGVKFLMFPRFVQVFLDSQVKGMLKHKEIHVTPSHTKKIFANMKGQGKYFSGKFTPLFETMMKHKSKKSKKRIIEVPQLSDSTHDVADEHVTTTSNDSLLSGEDRLKLTELMELCNQLQSRVLALETTKANQALEIGNLKRRVKKLEKKASKKTHKLKRLYKIGSSIRVKSFEDRRNDQDMFDTSILDDEEVVAKKEAITADPVPTAGEVVTTVGEVVTAASVEVSTAAITFQISMDEITLAKALTDIKTSKPKAKGIAIQEPSETPTDSSRQLSKSKDKGKAKLIEPEKLLKRKYQIMIDEEVARNLKARMQAGLEEEERLARQKIMIDEEVARNLKARMQAGLKDEERLARQKRWWKEVARQKAVLKDREVSWNKKMLRGKANVLADVMTRKERVKSRRARAMSMTIYSSIKAMILKAQSEASKGVNTLTEMLKGLDKQFERKEDGRLYLAERIWVPVYGNLRTLIVNEDHTKKASKTFGISSAAKDSRMEIREYHNGLYNQLSMKTTNGKLVHIKILAITAQRIRDATGSEYRLPSPNRWPT
nr:hypothetical protein [Tanacetum cinerariifolium]